MNSRILSSIANVIDSKDETKTRKNSGEVLLQDLLNSVQKCQNRFGGKSELATEDDIRVVELCERWERALSHGLRSNMSSSSIQNIVTAGLNFTFNVNIVGPSLWSYSCLHLTKHEQERFKILSNVNTPVGYFRAFLRASMNERSLERYLQSWLNHVLLKEYYEEGSLVRDSEASNLLPNMAAGLSTILFALSIDKVDLNDSLQSTAVPKSELVIPLPAPVKTTTNIKKKPLRQVISFDQSEQQTEVRYPAKDRRKSNQSPDANKSSWSSAPPTCLNSPDPKLMAYQNALSSNSEPTTSDYRSVRHFFPDSSKALDSPSQILTRLSERAKEIFSSTHSIDVNDKEVDASNPRLSRSDSEEVLGSIDGSVSCLELCFTDDENIPEENEYQSASAKKEKSLLDLQLKCSQMEIVHNRKIKKLENVILDQSRDIDRMKEQLKKYMSAVEIGKALKQGNNNSEEIDLYEKKLVQVAEMHAELMEFNEHLQRRLREVEAVSSIELADEPVSNVKVYIPAAFLVDNNAQSFHVYQIFIKVGQEEWNVFHRYAKFRELHMQLRKCHQDIATYKFPPKKVLGKKDASLVERRRAALQAYLRHVLLVLPELRECTTRAQLITLLPFFGSSSNGNNGTSGRFTRIFASRSRIDESNASTNSYAAL